MTLLNLLPRPAGVAVSLSAFALCAWTPALACMPAPGWNPSVAARFDAAVAVVLAKVVSLDEQGERWVYRLDVAETFKGPLPQPVWSPMNTCGMKLRPGTERVLFIWADGQLHQNGQPDYPSTAEVAAKARTLMGTSR